MPPTSAAAGSGSKGRGKQQGKPAARRQPPADGAGKQQQGADSGAPQKGPGRLKVMGASSSSAPASSSASAAQKRLQYSEEMCKLRQQSESRAFEVIQLRTMLLKLEKERGDLQSQVEQLQEQAAHREQEMSTLRSSLLAAMSQQASLSCSAEGLPAASPSSSSPASSYASTSSPQASAQTLPQAPEQQHQQLRGSCPLPPFRNHMRTPPRPSHQRSASQELSTSAFPPLHPPAHAAAAAPDQIPVSSKPLAVGSDGAVLAPLTPQQSVPAPAPTTPPQKGLLHLGGTEAVVEAVEGEEEAEEVEEEEQMGVVSCLEELVAAAVSSAEEQAAVVSSSEEQVAAVGSSEEQVAEVSSSEEQVAAVSSSEEQVAEVSSSEEQVAAVSSSEEQKAAVGPVSADGGRGREEGLKKRLEQLTAELAMAQAQSAAHKSRAWFLQRREREADEKLSAAKKQLERQQQEAERKLVVAIEELERLRVAQKQQQEAEEKLAVTVEELGALRAAHAQALQLLGTAALQQQQQQEEGLGGKDGAKGEGALGAAVVPGAGAEERGSVVEEEECLGAAVREQQEDGGFERTSRGSDSKALLRVQLAEAERKLGRPAAACAGHAQQLQSTRSLLRAVAQAYRLGPCVPLADPPSASPAAAEQLLWQGVTAVLSCLMAQAGAAAQQPAASLSPPPGKNSRSLCTALPRLVAASSYPAPVAPTAPRDVGVRESLAATRSRRITWTEGELGLDAGGKATAGGMEVEGASSRLPWQLRTGQPEAAAARNPLLHSLPPSRPGTRSGGGAAAAAVDPEAGVLSCSRFPRHSDAAAAASSPPQAAGGGAGADGDAGADALPALSQTLCEGPQRLSAGRRPQLNRPLSANAAGWKGRLDLPPRAQAAPQHWELPPNAYAHTAGSKMLLTLPAGAPLARASSHTLTLAQSKSQTLKPEPGPTTFS